MRKCTKKCKRGHITEWGTSPSSVIVRLANQSTEADVFFGVQFMRSRNPNYFYQFNKDLTGGWKG